MPPPPPIPQPQPPLDNPNSSGSLINWLLPFSIWTNSKRLFDFETAGTHGDLECIHGLRFFSMVWVIYGHTILYMEYQSFTHFYDVIETQIPSFLLLPSLNANFSVDTFFVISGILTTYVTWEYTKGDPRKFNKFAFTISRYIRLTPQLAIVILCFFLLPLFGDGPMYRQVTDKQADLCYKNWYINLLYLQSYTSSEKLCIDPSWWLSIEMTFHLVSMLVIIIMIQNATRGMWVNFVVAMVLTIWGACIHYTNGFAIQYLPSIPQRYEVSGEQTKMFFHRPYPHAASYFIGIALGYVLANRTIKKLSRAQVLQGWCVCAFGMVVSLWGSYYWNLGAPYTQLQATLYYHLCQVLWPASIAWIILACSLGHGGYVNSILSARCFVPLGRVTYMTYLSHALIIYYHSGSLNIPMEPSMLLFTYLFIANTSLALILGVLLTVVYESPVLNLQKQLFTYLTTKFDPTLRDAQCLPTRVAIHPDSLGQHQGQHQATLIDGDTADCGPLPVTKNGRPSMNSSAAANCLLLDAHSNKQTNNCNGAIR